MMQLIDGGIELIQLALGNGLFFMALLFGTLGWMLLEAHVRNPIDDPRHGYPQLVVVLTVLTAYDAAATKVTQLRLQRAEREQRARDEARDRHQTQLLEAVSELTVAIKQRQDLDLERTELVIDLSHRILDAIEHDEGGLSPNGHA